mgnify:CR=1 FL=1
MSCILMWSCQKIDKGWKGGIWQDLGVIIARENKIVGNKKKKSNDVRIKAKKIEKAESD